MQGGLTSGSYGGKQGLVPGKGGQDLGNGLKIHPHRCVEDLVEVGVAHILKCH